MSDAQLISDPQQAAQHLAHCLGGIPLTQLITRADDGSLRGRPMATQQVEYDGDLWFFTDDRSDKVREIGRHAAVHLSYSNMDGGVWVDVAGQAERVADPAKMKALWYDELAAYFPEGLDDPHLTLIKVTPTFAEIWAGPDEDASDEQAAQQTVNIKLEFTAA